MTSPLRRQSKSLMCPLVSSLVLWILLASATPAYAYIDPGSGSMMLQLLLGGMAGVMVLVRLYWSRLSERARSLLSRRPPAAK